MIRLTAVSAPVELDAADYARIAAPLLRIAPEQIDAVRVVRRAVDARRRDRVHLVLTLDVRVRGDEQAVLRRAKHPGAALAPPEAPAVWPERMPPPRRRPIVIGAGPAGLFAALTLAEAGCAPLLIEQGREAAQRRTDVAAFWRDGTLDLWSNVQFGEGGAGTFSDGKLNTGIKDARCRTVLRTLQACGAPEEILWQARPHVGTDHLVHTVAGIRARIEALGGVVRFGTRLTGLLLSGGAVRGVVTDGGEIETDAVVLCVGHSARDTFGMLWETGVTLVRKPFSIGVRIEHPQVMIDQRQYGRWAGHPALGAADYRLSTHLKNGRGVYTFCMCPGGHVVAAASEAGGVVTNGMSYFARDGQNANSALLVDVRPEDFPGEDPLAGVLFQRHWEARAYQAGGGGFIAPAQRVEDFLMDRPSARLGEVVPSYRPGVLAADLMACLPPFVGEALREGLPALDGRMPGFAHPDAVMTGVETRSSSPVRILRDARGMASAGGLFPAGEGAGYAGGITSAAVDGMRAAEQALLYLRDTANAKTIGTEASE